MNKALTNIKEYCRKHLWLVIVCAVVLVGALTTTTIVVFASHNELVGIEIKQLPTKTHYIEHQEFDKTGLKVVARYSNNSTKEITNYTLDCVGKITKVGDVAVTVSYTDGITKTTAFNITVDPLILTDISIISMPDKLLYEEGEYFDFLGMVVYASYANGPTEVVYDYIWDKNDLLVTDDTTVVISHTLHEVTKTDSIAVTVTEKPIQTPEEIELNSIIKLLPPVEDLIVDDLDAIDYVLDSLNNARQLTAEQAELKSALGLKQQEIIENGPPYVEPEYKISYTVYEHNFADINFGSNAAKYKNTDGAINLYNASSAIAANAGYEFIGWKLNGKLITRIENLADDITLYAVFEKTSNVNVTFKDYDNDAVLLELIGVMRTDELEMNDGLVSQIYNRSNKFGIVFYDASKTRINSANLTNGSTVTIYVKTVVSRELHLADAVSAAVAWKYKFTDNNGEQEISKSPNVGTAFVVPIGAEVTVTALHANISDIFVDGASKGSNLNSLTVEAVFVLEPGNFAASVTFATILNKVTTISFAGYNQKEVIYMDGWDGKLAQVDLDSIAFIYDETNTNYVVRYVIGGVVYLFADLSNYIFHGDTIVIAERVRNDFSFDIVYLNGHEKISNLTGKQSLQAVLDTVEDKEFLMKLMNEETLYKDSNFTIEIDKATLLQGILYDNIKVYCNYEKPIAVPDFGVVDYAAESFVGDWSAKLNNNGNILSVNLILAEDGTFVYKAYKNGDLITHLDGLYRIENNEFKIKTFTLYYEDDCLTADELRINIEFSFDGILRVAFIELKGTAISYFDVMLTKGAVRFVNYGGRDFVGLHAVEGINIDLRANGTAIMTADDIAGMAYYRLTADNRIWIFGNGPFGTLDLTDLMGGVI
jgi:hypothetical protein